MSSSDTAVATKKSRPGLAGLQKFGRSLMLPIAAMPAAALLLRFGSDDMIGKFWPAGGAVIAAAGGALFTWLPLLFAVGIAIGMAKKADGSTALAAVVGYMVFFEVLKAMSPFILGKTPAGTKQPEINFGVLGGVLIGLLSAWMWQKFYRTKLPTWLAFFGGRRLVPILTSIAALFLAVGMSFIYPAFNGVLTAVGTWVGKNAILGGFVFGMLNRLLIPLGLHHILNSVPWFQLGSYTDPAGKVWNGDIARFLHGDPTAGIFTTGFFPIMMFALPAAALAIWTTAKPQHKKVVGGLMLSAALTAIITGITEPLEFSFMFVAWPLYVIHAIFTGLSLAICNALGIRDGFGFSAGGTDLLLNWGIAEKPWLLMLVGLAFAVLYYFVFVAVIKWFNLKTPGREDEGEASMMLDDDAVDTKPARAKTIEKTVVEEAPASTTTTTTVTTE